EGLCGQRLVEIDPACRGGAGGAENEPSRGGQALAQPGVGNAEAAQQTIDHPSHDGTLTSRTMSATSACADAPANLACGSRTMRCARTVTASSCTCSGRTKSLPSNSASAFPACA